MATPPEGTFMVPEVQSASSTLPVSQEPTFEAGSKSLFLSYLLLYGFP